MQNLCFPEPPTPDTPGKGASWHYYTLISQTKIQRQAPGNWAVLNRAASRTKVRQQDWSRQCLGIGTLYINPLIRRLFAK